MRKQALIAKHIDGRESLNDMAGVFHDPILEIQGGNNYLDEHHSTLMERQKKDIAQSKKEQE
jgi:hypothetical protein